MLSEQIIAADWPAPANVRAFTTTRRGGTSHAPYDSLNLAHHVGDEPRRVKANRALLANELRLPTEPAWLDQQHGCRVVQADRAAAGTPPRADAAVALAAGPVCVVMTADCLPVLLCDTDGTRVAAVHAGWRGLASGVLDAAVAHLEPRGRTLMAWLGPAISFEAYEVDAPVRTRLLAACPEAHDAFAPTRPGHWMTDLEAVARHQLRRLGVRDCYGGGWCTYHDRARFYSHRRDGVCGRMASLIWLDR